MIVKVGEIVPDFEVTSTSGSFSLKQYRNKYLVLYFYPKDNTPGCTNEGKDFRDLYHNFKTLNAEIFGISRDSLATHTKFKEKHNFPFDLLVDTEEVACKLFDVIKEKSMFGKTALGLVRSTFVINPEGKLLQEWRKVKVNGHAEEVLEFLRLQTE